MSNDSARKFRKRQMLGAGLTSIALALTVGGLTGCGPRNNSGMQITKEQLEQIDFSKCGLSEEAAEELLDIEGELNKTGLDEEIRASLGNRLGNLLSGIIKGKVSDAEFARMCEIFKRHTCRFSTQTFGRSDRIKRNNRL